MLQWVLTSIICKTFESHIGRWQSKADTPKAMQITFRTSQPNREEGEEETLYWHKDLLIYAEANYVGVYTRDWWMPRFEDQEKGSGEWSSLAYHDSCWRDGIEQFIAENQRSFCTLDTLGLDDWFRTLEVSPELKQELAAARKKRYES